jgi:hypothetical protein
MTSRTHDILFVTVMLTVAFALAAASAKEDGAMAAIPAILAGMALYAAVRVGANLPK